MAWKKREKPLTEEEAIALAKQSLAPFWVGSTPRVAPVRHPDGRVTAHPLDPEFAKGFWLLFFLDPTRFDGHSGIQLAQEWHRRYSFKEIGFLGVFSTPFPFLRMPGVGEELKRDLPLPFPYLMDSDGLMAQAFSVTRTPSILLLSQGQVRASFSGEELIGKSEAYLQTVLRESDPGLPLPPVLNRIEDGLKDVLRIDFFENDFFPKPGFAAGAAPGRETARFQPAGAEDYPSPGIRISGSWTREGARIQTSDPGASILFRSPGTHVAVIAQSLAKDASVNSEILVELDGKAVYDAVSGPDLRMTDEGQTVHRPGAPKLAHLLIHLPEKNRNVALRFPTADQAAVALYGIRIGSPG